MGISELQELVELYVSAWFFAAKEGAAEDTGVPGYEYATGKPQLPDL